MAGNLRGPCMRNQTLRYFLVAVLVAMYVHAFGAEAHSEGSVVLLNNVPVLKIKTSTGSVAQDALASAVAKRLRAVDDQGEVSSVQVGSTEEIRVAGSTVITVSQAEGAAHGVAAKRLADLWSSAIRDALLLPPLKFSIDSLRAASGTTSSIKLVGSLAFGADFSSSNEAIASVIKVDGGVTVTCKEAGDAVIQARSGNATRAIAVFVRPLAAALPQSFAVTVTGHPASAELIQGAVEGCLKSRVVCVPGATCSFAKLDVKPLDPSKSEVVSAFVRLHSADAFDAVGNVLVSVHNTPTDYKPESALWYSNAPESVTQVGSLFASFLKPQTPIRLLYHHVNASSQPIILRVEAVNDSEQSAKFLVTPGDTKPDKNPVRAGMTSGSQFLRLWQHGSGEVIEMPPHTNATLSIRRLIPNETSSGLCRLEQLSGPDILVRVDALPAFELSGAWYEATFSSTPWHEVGCRPINEYDRAMYEPSSHVYPNPNKIESFEYSVGNRAGTLLIGQQPIAGQDHTTNLDGNFGVMYTVTATAKNPSASSVTVELVFEASAGYMGGLFLIDGAFVQTHLMNPKEQSRLCKVRLEPGASKQLQIVTFPVSGGSYPATLILRAVE